MRYLNNYEKFNEEINLKKAIVGGALAASTLVGCNTPNSNYNPDIDPRTQVTQTKETGKSFTMEQNIVSFGTDMDISTGGRVEERLLSFGRKFEYFDKSGKLKATAKERVFSLGNVIEITDENGRKIGSVEQEIIESMFSLATVYSIKSADGRVLAESEKLDFFTTNVSISDNEGGDVTMSKAFISIGDSWDVEINSNIDERLIIFIPSFISAAQSSKKSE